jgi:ubiquinone/menaquinone biosynthesis C-methylase UbiE
MTRGGDSKESEKAYVVRSGSAAWEAAKPFSPPGSDTLGESARLLHDFAVAMMALQPEPDDLVLDLGAGGCWCSDLLGRLNRRSVAIDISLDMLRIGRSRAGSAGIAAVAADFETLPFADRSFDKAICLNALHHVPNVPKAVREISRVLTDTGVAVFSEPGRGHADADVSVSAMRDFGVLEQDILIGPFARACAEAGFQHVRIKSLSYVVPLFELTPDEWERWSRSARQRRPMRAFTKMWRAALEFTGFGKKGPLFEEAVERSLTRALFGAMDDHPIIVASKSVQQVHGDHEWAARLGVHDLTAAAAPAGLVRASIDATNTGARAWHPSSRSGIGYITLGVQLLDEGGRLIDRNFQRVRLDRTVQPQQSVRLVAEFQAPHERGAYRLKFDLVAEGIAWFESFGSQPVVRTLRVD